MTPGTIPPPPPASIPPTTGRLLGTADVARLRKTGRHAARRYLLTLEAEFGAKLVRDKKGIYISDDTLRQFGALVPAVTEERRMREVTRLRGEVGDLKARVSSMEAAHREFRRLAHEWLMKAR